MKEINLMTEQRLYLQHILDYFRNNSQWPTHRYLDGIFYEKHSDLDIEVIWKSLPQDLTSYMDINQPDSKATLNVPAIYLLEKNAPELATFLKVLKVCVANYRPSDENWISNETIIMDHPTWRPDGIRRSGLLLLVEPGIWQTFGGPDENGNWTCKPARLIRRFREVTTIEEYLEKRNPYRETVSAPTIPETANTDTSITAQYILHPDIHEQCWSLYEQEHYDNAILNATKAIEVTVRKKSNLSDDTVGADLINKAFTSNEPILRYSETSAEQQGMMSLLRGIIMVYKNPQSHRFVRIENKSECLGIILMCSNILYAIDNINVSQDTTA